MPALRLVAIIALFIAAVRDCRADGDEHLALGNPSNARPDASDRNNFLMKKPFFAVSYNDSLGTPNWVSWHLTIRHLGNAPRDAFHADETLPPGFRIIEPSDYTGSGFDRGHLCPHSDRAASEAMSSATFVMTNMVPQSPENNQKAWDQLENYLRTLVKNENKQIHIVAGPHGRGGVARNGFKSVINKNGHRIVVPAVTWKVALIRRASTDPMQRVDGSARLIGVVVPNNHTPGLEWDSFRGPVREIEALTGYTFFQRVNSPILEQLNPEVDEIPIPPPSVIHHGAIAPAE
jgi:endonuclease G